MSKTKRVSQTRADIPLPAFSALSTYGFTDRASSPDEAALTNPFLAAKDRSSKTAKHAAGWRWPHKYLPFRIPGDTVSPDAHITLQLTLSQIGIPWGFSTHLVKIIECAQDCDLQQDAMQTQQAAASALYLISKAAIDCLTAIASRSARARRSQDPRYARDLNISPQIARQVLDWPLLMRKKNARGVNLKRLKLLDDIGLGTDVAAEAPNRLDPYSELALHLVQHLRRHAGEIRESPKEFARRAWVLLLDSSRHHRLDPTLSQFLADPSTGKPLLKHKKRSERMKYLKKNILRSVSRIVENALNRQSQSQS